MCPLYGMRLYPHKNRGCRFSSKKNKTWSTAVVPVQNVLWNYRDDLLPSRQYRDGQFPYKNYREITWQLVSVQ